MAVEEMIKPVEQGGLAIDRSAAEAAHKAPRMDPGSAEAREAAGWAESLVGKVGRPERLRVVQEMDTAHLTWQFAERANAARPKELRGGHVARIQGLFDEYVAKVQVYKKLPEEADAYRIEAQFRKALEEHQAALSDAMPKTMPPPR